jgi:hypothetical protein
LTLDEALEAIAAVDAPGIRSLAEKLICDEALRMSVVAPGRYLRGLDARLALPGVTV